MRSSGDDGIILVSIIFVFSAALWLLRYCEDVGLLLLVILFSSTSASPFDLAVSDTAIINGTTRTNMMSFPIVSSPAFANEPGDISLLVVQLFLYFIVRLIDFHSLSV